MSDDHITKPGEIFKDLGFSEEEAEKLQKEYDEKHKIEYCSEFTDFHRVLQFGSKKYAANNWLLPDGKSSDRKSMFSSVNRHVAQAYCGDYWDKDSGLPHILLAITRLQMIYTRGQRDIVHPDDEPTEQEGYIDFIDAWNKEDHLKVANWVEKQMVKDDRCGTIGDRFTYEFTPTGLGTITVIKDNYLKEKLDITDYDKW